MFKKIIPAIIVIAAIGYAYKSISMPDGIARDNDKPVVKIEAPKEEKKAAFSNGSYCKISAPSKKVFAGHDELTAWDIRKAIKENDTRTLAALALEGKVYGVDDLTRCQVVDEKPLFPGVKILEGQLKNKIVYVNKDYLVEYDRAAELERELAKQKQGQLDKLEAKEKAAQAAKDKDEERASDLLKTAKRWIADNDKELALRSLNELLKRFPDSKAAPEAREMKGRIEGK